MDTDLGALPPDIGAPDEYIPMANRRETLLGVFCSFGALAIFAVGLRLFARFRSAERFGFDDGLVALALISITTGSILLCFAAYAGLGSHFILMTPDEMSAYLFRFYLANATYALSTTLLKLSLLCQYLRIFTSGTVRLAIWAMIGICAVWGAVTAFMTFFPCFPVKAYWDRTITDATCYAYGSMHPLPFYRAYVAHGVLNWLFDFIVLVFPAPAIFRKAMSRREKFAAFGLGSLGLFVVATCAWKLAEVVKTRATHSPYFDPSWWSPIMVILAALEVDLGILAVSCPVFWPMIEEQVLGIVVQQEVHITTQRMDRFQSLDDIDDKSDQGSEAALATESGASSAKQPYYTQEEEIALKPVGLGQTDTTIKAPQRSQVSWLDTRP